jgi:hypothetical protein
VPVPVKEPVCVPVRLTVPMPVCERVGVTVEGPDIEAVCDAVCVSDPLHEADRVSVEDGERDPV